VDDTPHPAGDLRSTVLAAAVLALLAGPLGTAVFVLGFGRGDSPCVLCWAQRTVMVLIALTGLFVLRFGPRPRYLGLGVLLAAAGIYMGIRHAALHLARDVGQGFSLELAGAHTYTWSAFIFWVCALVMGALLVSLRDGEAARRPRPLQGPARAAAWLFLLVVAGNVVQAFASTGPPPFMGQSDPVRFSFDPRRWVWSLEEWAPAPISLRGRWAIEKPSLAGLPTDPGAGPLAGAAPLAVSRQLRLALPVDGPLTDLAYDAGTDRFLLTTSHGLYLVDGTLGRVLAHVIVDPGYSVDLARFGAAAFLESDTVAAVSENKSLVILREHPRPDHARNSRVFLTPAAPFDEVARTRISTVRARMQYVLAAAYDPASSSLYTFTVPNARHRRLVVSRVDRTDLTLSEEFLPRLAPDSPLRFRGPERSLDELYVSGATLHGGRLVALSAAFGTIIAIDPAARTVAEAFTISGLERPVGLAFRKGELYVAGEDGRVWVAVLPAPAAAGPPVHLEPSGASRGADGPPARMPRSGTVSAAVPPGRVPA
jgi:disulfide bond formation protein DsbB